MSKQKIADELAAVRAAVDRLESALVEREAGQILVNSQIKARVEAILKGTPDEATH